MSNEQQAPLAGERLAKIRARSSAVRYDFLTAAADEYVWQLFGGWEHPEPRIHPQLIKAPKQGTPYAEYWPEPELSDFLAHSLTDIRALLAEIDRLRADLATEQQRREEAERRAYETDHGAATLRGAAAGVALWLEREAERGPIDQPAANALAQSLIAALAADQQRREEVEAGAAALREAAEATKKYLVFAWVIDERDDRPSVLAQQVDAALATDAGRALAERVRRYETAIATAREALERAREWLPGVQCDNQDEGDALTADEQRIEAALNAIAALDADGGGTEGEAEV